MKLSVLIVNINNLAYTKSCLGDLSRQDSRDFSITLVDQGSTEPGTEDFLQSAQNNLGVKVIRNGYNKPLNWIWNDFYRDSETPYLCFLNNDVKLTENFISDTIHILDTQSGVGAVVHSANSWKWNSKMSGPEWVYLDYRIKQGFDFAVRREAYSEVPEILKFYWGDDWIFHNVYERGYNVAICLSSPIIHWGEKSSGFSPVSYKDEEENFHNLGLTRYLPHYNPYSEVTPTFLQFGTEPIRVFIFTSNEDLEELQNYVTSDEISNLNKMILNETGGDLEKISRFLRDTVKIRSSIEIFSALTKGHKFIIFKLDLFTQLWEQHLPYPVYIESVNQLKEILIQ